MQIDVEYTEAFERSYIASRAHRPLIELASGESEPLYHGREKRAYHTDPSRDRQDDPG